MKRNVAALLLLVFVASCSGPTQHAPPPKQWHVEKHPAPPDVKRHASHEHAHGEHPHSGNAHHHHPHPHPHMAGPDGHHHPY